MHHPFHGRPRPNSPSSRAALGLGSSKHPTSTATPSTLGVGATSASSLPELSAANRGNGTAFDLYGGVGSLDQRPTLRELADTSTFYSLTNRYSPTISRANKYSNTAAEEILGGGKSPSAGKYGSNNLGDNRSSGLPSLFSSAQKDHPLRVRKRAGLDTHVDECPAVKQLEERLTHLESTRVKKLNELEQRNARLVERDRLRHEQYLREYKSAEQLEALRLEGLRAELQKKLDKLCEEEAIRRSFEEEEEAYEYRNELSILHLSIYSTTVALVTAENERKQNQLKLIEEEEQRRLDTHTKILELLVKEAFDAKRDIERLEFNDRKVVVQQIQSAMLQIQQNLQNRKQEDFTVKEKAREREHEKREAERAREVQEAEEALEERMRRLDERCERLRNKIVP